jgi:hypothetical protein
VVDVVRVVAASLPKSGRNEVAAWELDFGCLVRWAVADPGGGLQHPLNLIFAFKLL